MPEAKKIGTIINTILNIYPPVLILLVVYVQVVLAGLNYSLFDSRELAILLCWIPLFTIPIYYIKKPALKKIIITFFFIEGFINLAHLLVLKGPINASSLFIISNTNTSEALAFFELKLNVIMLLIIPYIGFFIWAIHKGIQNKIVKLNKYVVALVIIFSIVFIGENIANERFIRKGIPQTEEALVSLVQEMKSFNALKKRTIIPVNAQVNLPKNKQQTFVLIIGESCNRNHMSIYGYDKNTTPKLAKRDDVIVYKNVVSPYSNTISSVLSILTASNLDNKISFDKSTSIIDVFHSAGFKTYWLSNQSPIGVWDNAIYNLAQTTDNKTFVNNKGNSSFESTYLASHDGELLAPFNNILNNNHNKLIIVHLMGSHSAYAKRYPTEFDLFNNHSNNKQRLINEYDNSVLYNDFIMDSIFSLLKSHSLVDGKELVSCIYLSDHGENVYDENDNVGHDYAGAIPKSNVEIPFMVWHSLGYKNMFPEKTKAIQLNKHLPAVSDDLFHTIIDLNNITYDGLLNDRSIINPQFNSARKRILEDNLDYDLK